MMPGLDRFGKGSPGTLEMTALGVVVGRKPDCRGKWSEMLGVGKAKIWHCSRKRQERLQELVLYVWVRGD